MLLVFLVYLTAIFEGALRKWFFPGLSSEIFFAKDLIVLVAYGLAFYYRLWPRNNHVFDLSLVLMLLFVPLSILQPMVTGVHPIVTLYGARCYFLYIPFAFLIGEHFSPKDLIALIRLTLFLMIPVAWLVSVQFNMPSDAPINLLPGGVESFWLAQDKIRPAGTFASSAAQALLTASAAAMAMASFLMPPGKGPLPMLLLLPCAAAVLVCLIHSGTRTVWFMLMLLVLGTVLSGIIMLRKARLLRVFLILLSVPLILTSAVWIYVNMFPAAFQAMSERAQGAFAVEGGRLARLNRMFLEVLQVFDTPLIGRGVGIGTGGGGFLGRGKKGSILAENEWPRIVQEGGLYGVVFVLYRIFLTGWLIAYSVVATRRSGNPLPLLLASFVGPTLLIGQVTYGGVQTGYTWMFVGFQMAANKLGMRGGASRS